MLEDDIVASDPAERAETFLQRTIIGSRGVAAPSREASNSVDLRRLLRFDAEWRSSKRNASCEETPSVHFRIR
jgi:hypothetical protein